MNHEHTCGECKHADLYIPYYTRPYGLPKCYLTGLTVHSDDRACEDFKSMR